MVKSVFIIGDRKEGYAVKAIPGHGLTLIQRIQRGKALWESQVWLKGKIVRRDSHRAIREAINYCHQRYRSHQRTGLKVHFRSNYRRA
jgi:hypothetical protein